jgi:hypothetical protein
MSLYKGISYLPLIISSRQRRIFNLGKGRLYRLSFLNMEGAKGSLTIRRV